jgi:hypothetical protein
MNRHTLLDVYLGLRADSLRAVTGAIMLASAGGAADAAIHKPGGAPPAGPSYSDTREAPRLPEPPERLDH